MSMSNLIPAKDLVTELAYRIGKRTERPNSTYVDAMMVDLVPACLKSRLFTTAELKEALQAAVNEGLIAVIGGADLFQPGRSYLERRVRYVNGVIKRLHEDMVIDGRKYYFTPEGNFVTPRLVRDAFGGEAPDKEELPHYWEFRITGVVVLNTIPEGKTYAGKSICDEIYPIKT